MYNVFHYIVYIYMYIIVYLYWMHIGVHKKEVTSHIDWHLLLSG